MANASLSNMKGPHRCEPFILFLIDNRLDII